MDDIRPLFFATQVSSQLRRPHTQQLRTKHRNQNNQQQVLSPYQRLKRMKEQMERSKREYFKTFSQTHRLELSLNKLERKKHQTRNEFTKIYGNLKYKKFLQETKSENDSRNKRLEQQRQNNTKKKKLQEQLQKMLSRNQQQEKIQMLQIKNRRDKDKLAQIKQRKKGDVLNWSKLKHDSIKSQHTQFVVRKSNISTILQQRSKLNHMKKVNKELSLLKQYENVIDEIGSFDIEEIKKLAENQDKLNMYETFFMTTKNTIS